MIRRALLLAAIVTSAPALAAPVLIKLGTVAPKDSKYEELLEDMGKQWAEASGGQVKVRIYPGGIAGNEGDMVRKIGVGQLQGASLTTVGMHDISPEPQALNIPMMIQSDGELQYVIEKIRPRLDAALAAKGFVAVNWANVGEVRIFSTFPLSNVAQIGQAKVWAWEGDPAAAEGWRLSGFQPVVLSSTDIIPSLQTGMINTLTEPPLYAFASRTFDKAHYMLDLSWTLLTGATVIKKETWDKIAPDVQQKLKAIADESAKKLSGQIREMNSDAVVQMKSQGLVVEKPDNVAAWEGVAKKAWPYIRTKVIPTDIFDQVQKLVAEYRASHK